MKSDSCFMPQWHAEIGKRDAPSPKTAQRPLEPEALISSMEIVELRDLVPSCIYLVGGDDELSDIHAVEEFDDRLSLSSRPSGPRQPLSS